MTDARFFPDRPLPPYAYVGSRGPYPHPRNHPQGHSHGQPAPSPVEFDPSRWRESESYLWGFDLFNEGYYWEAHEAWEDLWVGTGRRGPIAALFLGLIKLAAAGFKVREDRPAGVRKHARRAEEHLTICRASLGPEVAGLDLNELIAFARELAERDAWPRDRGETAHRVFDREVVPS